jgi:hypothetical protein
MSERELASSPCQAPPGHWDQSETSEPSEQEDQSQDDGAEAADKKPPAGNVTPGQSIG